jgi:hypothetical protein
MSKRVGRAGPARARLRPDTFWPGTFQPVRLTGRAGLGHRATSQAQARPAHSRAGPQPVKARRALTGWEENEVKKDRKFTLLGFEPWLEHWNA